MKTNSKKPNKLLMIFGLIFILVGIIMAISFESKTQKEQAFAVINQKEEAIKSDAVFVFNFLPTVEKYSVDVIENANNGYDINIIMNDLSDGEKFKEWCFLNGTNFIYIIKEIYPDTDDKVINYNFTFIGNSYTYTSIYVNNDDHIGFINDMKFILMNGKIPLPTPNYNKCREYFYDHEINEIITAVEGSIKPLAVDVIKKGDGFDVNITIIDDGYSKTTNCALMGINFLERIKTFDPDIDKKIIHYNISYMSGPKTTYTSEYTNGSDESKYTIKLAIKDGDTILPAKTRMQYYKDTLIYDPKDTMIMSGTSFQVLVDDNGIYSIQPKTEADKIRDPDSTLMKYEQEFVSQYFTLKNVQMTIDTELKKANITMSYTDNTEFEIQNVSIYCDFINKNGEIIYRSYYNIFCVEKHQTYSPIVQMNFKDQEPPASFRIIRIDLHRFDINKNKNIIFD